MSLTYLREQLRTSANRTVLRISLLVAVGLLSTLSLIYPIAIRPASFQLKIGDVALQDIQAPRTLTYSSEVQTEQARKDAERLVSPVFLSADPVIARQQLENLHGALVFINSVRQDSFADPKQQLSDMEALDNLHMNRDEAIQLLNLNENKWEVVQQESLRVLEETMRLSIRQGQVTDAQHRLPTLISFSLSQDQASMVATIATPYIIANSLFSEDLTNASIQEARNAVTPIDRTYITGETIIRRGQVISPTTWEALQQFGLIETKRDLPNIVAAFSLVSLTSGFLGLYFSRRKISPLNDFRSLLLISFTFLLFLYGGRLIIPNRTVIPYLFPIAAFGLTISSLYNIEIGLIFSFILSILTAFGLPNSLDLTIYYTLSSFVGILILEKGRRIASFFWTGVAIGLSGSAIILAYRLIDSITDWIGLATLVGISFLNGLASASLTLLFQFFFSQLLGLTTSLQLLDLSRPDHPLLQFMLRNAPGSYQHSLQVANLAEQAAESIGADALLTRVGAIYHDVGKASNPMYYIENQVPGKTNPHDEIDPSTSASIIIRHVRDGIQLARKYRLPNRIQDFMREHHGTNLTRYQYARALLKANGEIDQINLDLFRYPGPSPQSRETALLMLADGCEARARAELPKDEKELRSLIKKVIDQSMTDGQLDHTTLTLRDLNTVAESFMVSLKNAYHPRIQYPEIQTAVTLPSDEGVEPVNFQERAP